MNHQDVEELANLVVKELGTEIRRIFEPIVVTILATQLQRNARDVLTEPLSLEEAVSMAMTFIHQTRRQIYPHIVHDSDGTDLDGSRT
jgi:hypothetical protein